MRVSQHSRALPRLHLPTVRVRVLVLVVSLLLQCFLPGQAFLSPSIIANRFVTGKTPVRNDWCYLQRRVASTSTSTSSAASTPKPTFATISKPNKASVRGSYRTNALVASSQTATYDSASLPKPSVASTITTTTADYQRGMLTVGLITVLFASNSPAIHAAFSQVTQAAIPPPVFFINAAVSVVALAGVALGGPILDRVVPDPQRVNADTDTAVPVSTTRMIATATATEGPVCWGLDRTHRAGLELGFWKFLGTTANLSGLALTTADHGAFLIQLTTLLVPAAQGATGVSIPTRIWTAIALAMAGVALLTQDAAGVDTAQTVANIQTAWLGDVLCIVAAVFYAIYDLRLFAWGKQVAPLPLITNKVATQATLSVTLLLATSGNGGWDSCRLFFETASTHDLTLVAAVTIWSGVIVNGVVPYLQVGAQQAVGPARAQIVYASQPIWAGILAYLCLGETLGVYGGFGAVLFVAAIGLAATAPSPDPDCPETSCEV
jgi:drug/metabolite transporter (DMT)-like permease